MPRGENRPQFGQWRDYTVRPPSVRAAQVRNGQTARAIITKFGAHNEQTLRAGDWLVIYPDGTQEVYTNEAFQAKFQ